MTEQEALFSDTLLSYHRSLYLRVASLSESQVGRVIAGDGQSSGTLARQKRYVIRSPEGGNNDFGVLVGRDYPEGLKGNDISKYSQLLGSTEVSDLIIPLDGKCFMPLALYGTATWTLCLTPQQMKTCQALIVTTPKEPDFAILLPMYYLRQKKQTVHRDGSANFHTRGYRPLWTLHPLPAFPPELTPFVFPFSELEQALADMRDYSIGSATEWVNAYTGVTFVDVPRPDSFRLSVLEPDLPTFRRALDEIVVLFRAFERYSKNYRINYCDIRPVFGDFKITHLLTGEDSYVEDKICHCRMEQNTETGLLSLQHLQTSLASTDRALFTWRVTWDYLYTHITSSSGRQLALFAPRDRIPKTWWNVPLSEEPVWLDWPADHTDSWDKYLVDRTTDDRLVHDIEEILRKNPAKAQEPIPMASVNPATLTEMNSQPETAQSFIPEEKWNSSTFRRGYGSAAHAELRGETYQVWASEVLLELCRARGRGTVLDLGGTKSINRYWLADYGWSEDDMSRYDLDKEPPCPVWRLGARTPIAPVSFLRLSWHHGFEPWCVRSSEYSAKVIASHPPSLVICDLFPYACARFPHSRFLLPSDSLPEVSYGRKFTLKEGLLDQYSVDCDDIVDSILNILDGKSQTTIGLCNRPIQTSRYIHYLQDVWQAVATELAKASEDEDDVAEEEVDVGGAPNV